jgi:hypothetical protein
VLDREPDRGAGRGDDAVHRAAAGRAGAGEVEGELVAGLGDGQADDRGSSTTPSLSTTASPS